MRKENKTRLLTFNLGAHCLVGKGRAVIETDNEFACNLECPVAGVNASQTVNIVSDLYTNKNRIQVELKCSGCEAVPKGFTKVVVGKKI